MTYNSVCPSTIFLENKLRLSLPTASTAIRTYVGPDRTRKKRRIIDNTEMLPLKETNQFKKVICLFLERERSADEDDKGWNRDSRVTHTHTRSLTAGTGTLWRTMDSENRWYKALRYQLRGEPDSNTLFYIYSDCVTSY